MNNGSHNIKRGVSLYSYQEEYFLRKVGLEECLRFSASVGACGIESVAGQMMPGFPDLSPQLAADWERWKEEYGLIATAHDAIPYQKLYKGRERPVDELVADLIIDIDYALRLGAHIVRVHSTVPNGAVEGAAPYAAEKGVRLLKEIHAPHRFDTPWFDSHMEVAERFGPQVVGLLPDLGIFTKRLPQVMSERALRDGADPDYVARVLAKYEEDQDMEELMDEARRRELPRANLDLSFQASRMINEDPRKMLEYMPYIGHIHAKFYDMVDDTTEYSIDYAEIIGVLIAGGYDGYLSSEYEGNRHVQDEYPVDSFEQVRRQQAMMAAILGDSADD